MVIYLKVRFNQLVSWSILIGPAAKYLVLDTDYNQFSTVYSCSNLGIFKLEFAWVLARSNSISSDVLNKAKDVFARNGVDFAKFQSTSQVNCTY